MFANKLIRHHSNNNKADDKFIQKLTFNERGKFKIMDMSNNNKP